MIDLANKTIIDEKIQWRRLKEILEGWKDRDGVIRNLYIANCEFTALPRTIEPTLTEFESKPWWAFWRQAKETNRVLGFKVEGAVISTTSFERVPKREAKKVVPAKVRGPKRPKAQPPIKVDKPLFKGK